MFCIGSNSNISHNVIIFIPLTNFCRKHTRYLGTIPFLIFPTIKNYFISDIFGTWIKILLVLRVLHRVRLCLGGCLRFARTRLLCSTARLDFLRIVSKFLGTMNKIYLALQKCYIIQKSKVMMDILRTCLI